jgi:hypothetical protein
MCDHLYIAIILYYIEFYHIWVVTLCISSDVTEKENDDYVPFFNCFIFCTDYNNDFKVGCMTFYKLYSSFREPTEFLLVW